MNAPLNHLFSSPLLQTLMERASTAMQRYLTECSDNPERVLPWQNPHDLLRIIELLFEDALGKTRESVSEELDPRYIEAFHKIESDPNQYLMVVEQQLGEWMVKQAIDYAKANDAHIVQLTTNKQRTRAKRFYERLGFVASHEGMKLYLSN